MKISVIIPTYKRPRDLLRAVKSLQGQTLQDFEIIVVDNASEKKIKILIRKFNKEAKIPAKYIAEPVLGWHNANHKGTRYAKSELLLFTNDDVTFEPFCLASYVEAFEKYPQMVASGGPIRPVFETPPPKWLKDLMGKSKVFTPFSLMDLSNKFQLSKNGFFFTTNMVIRKDQLFSFGGFNPEIFGDVRLGDGEIGLNRKIKKRGYLIGYVPDAIVYHHIPKERMSIDALEHWMSNAGAIDMYTLFHEKGIPRNWLGFVTFVWPIIRINLKYWIGNLFFKSPKASVSIKIKLQTARSLAQLDYIKRLMHDKDLQKLVAKKNWLKK